MISKLENVTISLTNGQLDTELYNSNTKRFQNFLKPNSSYKLKRFSVAFVSSFTESFNYVFLFWKNLFGYLSYF